MGGVVLRWMMSRIKRIWIKWVVGRAAFSLWDWPGCARRSTTCTMRYFPYSSTLLPHSTVLYCTRSTTTPSELCPWIMSWIWIERVVGPAAFSRWGWPVCAGRILLHSYRTLLFSTVLVAQQHFQAIRIKWLFGPAAFSLWG
jgi:hypothetical protein